MITQKPDEEAEEFFYSLSNETKSRIKMMMDERKKMIEQNEILYSLSEIIILSLGVKSGRFWQLMEDWIKEQEKNSTSAT